MTVKKFSGTIAMLGISGLLLGGCAGAAQNSSADQNTSTFTNSEGQQETASSGDQRPAEVPADVPSLSEGKDFGWLGTQDTGSLNFVIDSTDFTGACDRLGTMAKSFGWNDYPESNSNVTNDTGRTVMYKKTGYALEISCVSRQDGGSRITLTRIADETLQ